MFGFWCKIFGKSVKTAFYLGRRTFWGKHLCKDHLIKECRVFLPICLGWFVWTVFELTKYLDRIATIACNTSRKTIWGKECLDKKFEIWLFLELWWKVIGKLVETAFYVRRETFWVEPFVEKLVGSHINFKIWQKFFFSCVRCALSLHGHYIRQKRFSLKNQNFQILVSYIV